MTRKFVGIVLVISVLFSVFVLPSESFVCHGAGTIRNRGVEQHFTRQGGRPHVRYDVAYLVGQRSYVTNGYYDPADSKASNWTPENRISAEKWMIDHPAGSKVDMAYHCIFPSIAVASVGTGESLVTQGRVFFLLYASGCWLLLGVALILLKRLLLARRKP